MSVHLGSGTTLSTRAGRVPAPPNESPWESGPERRSRESGTRQICQTHSRSRRGGMGGGDEVRSGWQVVRGSHTAPSFTVGPRSMGVGDSRRVLGEGVVRATGIPALAYARAYEGAGGRERWAFGAQAAQRAIPGAPRIGGVLVAGVGGGAAPRLLTRAPMTEPVVGEMGVRGTGSAARHSWRASDWGGGTRTFS